jgi:hypothetical protein
VTVFSWRCALVTGPRFKSECSRTSLGLRVELICRFAESSEYKSPGKPSIDRYTKSFSQVSCCRTISVTRVCDVPRHMQQPKPVAVRQVKIFAAPARAAEVDQLKTRPIRNSYLTSSSGQLKIDLPDKPLQGVAAIEFDQ